MANMNISGSQYITEYQDVEVSLPGQQLPWLVLHRSSALQSFSKQGFPSPRQEEWRYTNIAAIEKKLFKPTVGDVAAEIDKDWLKSRQLEDSWTVVLIDGRFSAEHSSLEGVPDGVIIMNMAEALRSCPERIESRLGKAIIEADHGFINLNMAWFSDGLFVHVPNKTVLAKPIQLLHVVTRSDSLATTRNIIDLGAMAEVKILETYIGDEEVSYLTAAVTEVFVGRNAGLELYKVQQEALKAFHFGGTYVQQDRNSRFKHHSFSFGGLLARNELHCALEEASECELNGLYTGIKQQHMDHHTRINHIKPNAISREYYKSILDQRARGVFQGRVVVFEDAQKTDSEMHNRNLLLSEHAEADTKPQLEIYADDVKCAHGVTVGQLEDKAMFYLQSRGVDKDTAKQMLTFAFANEMVEKVNLDTVKVLILNELLTHLPQTGIVREWL